VIQHRNDDATNLGDDLTIDIWTVGGRSPNQTQPEATCRRCSCRLSRYRERGDTYCAPCSITRDGEAAA